jgi:hypothetical protein
VSAHLLQRQTGWTKNCRDPTSCPKITTDRRSAGNVAVLPHHLSMTRKRGSVKDAEISDSHQSINERIGAMDRPQMAEDKFAIEDNPQQDPP